jgi:hypothetical protein
LSEGSAAITALRSTSARPDDAEKMIVPMTSPRYAQEGKNVGQRTKMTRPSTLIRGVSLTVMGILNLCEKKLKTRSTSSCVEKFKSTKRPRSENDIPNLLWKVKKSIGGRLPIIAIDTFIQ